MPSGDFAQQREELSTFVDQLRTRVGPGAVDTLLEAIGALDVAQEELRVADEELRAQRDQISLLLQRHEAEVLWRTRLTESLPLALVQTRADGVVIEANTAAAALLDRRIANLLGKPLVALVAPADHMGLRTALAALLRGEGQQKLVVSLLVGGRTVPVTAVGLVDDRPGLQWAFLPETHPRAAGVLDEHDVRTAAALAEMCGLPVAGSDRQQLLHRLAELAQQAVPRAAAISITLGSPEQPQWLSSDRALALEVDGAQMQVGEGPCVQAFRTREVVLTPDVRLDERWPRLAARVAGLAVGSTLAVPVSAGDECLGVLNAYSEPPTAFDEVDVRVSQLVGDSVSSVLQTVAERSSLTEVAANLERALDSRAVIDQAKGMIMARYHCTADEAFTRLSVLSQRSNVKLREIARVLVDGSSGTEGEPPVEP